MPTRFTDDDQRTRTPSDDDLRHITGIGPDEEDAMDREAISGAAQDILGEERDAAKGRIREQTGPAPANSRIQRGGFGVPNAPEPTVQRGGFGATAKANAGLDDLAAKEKQPGAWQSNLGGKQKTKGMSSKLKKRITISVLMTVAVSLIGVAAFFIFLPFKIVNLIENLQEAASHLVDRPVEKRMDFLVTRYLTAKIIAGDNKNEFDAYICDDNGIMCSVLGGWFTSRFEDKLGLTIESNRLGGGRATAWKITTREGTVITGEGGNADEIFEQVTREIKGSNLMRAYIKDEVKNKTRWYNFIKRYALRKMLMKKYGIRSWKGPEKLDEKLDNYEDYKRKVKLKLQKTLSLASLGRVVKNTPKYLACLVGDGLSSCKSLQTDEAPTPNQPDDGSGDEKTQAAHNAANQGQDAIGSDSSQINIDAIIDEASASGGTTDQVAEEVRKLVTRRLLATAVAGIGLVDLLANAVEKIDEGAVNAIFEHKNELAYVGYATEVTTSVHKIKDGDMDPEIIQAYGEIFNNYEQSPLAQHEMQTAAQLGQPGHEVRRDCDDDGKLETLQTGEFICPNKKVTADQTAFVTSWPPWDAIVVPIAKAWNNTAGAIFDFFNDIAGGLLGALGINKLMDWIMDVTGVSNLLESVIDNIFGTLFGSPITGAEQDADAYDATSIGVKAMYNGMMKNGVDQSGLGMGMGGMPLSPGDIAQINQAATAERNESFKAKPLLARLFDPDLNGSAVHTLIARTPMNVSRLISSPVNQLAGMFSVTANAYPYVNENPAGLVVYGYPENSDVYTKPIDTYTEETCKQMAEARDASYDLRGDEISPRYHQTDPCALEKVICVAASTMTENNKCADEFKLYSQPAGANDPSSPISGTPGQTIPKGKGFSLQNNTDYSATACAEGSTETRIYTHPQNGYKIRLCKVKSMEVASIISDKLVAMVNDAARAGVSLNGGGFRTYEDQIATRRRNCSGDPLSPSARCSPPTATPGASEHERGLAIDFTATGTIVASSPHFKWLSANAARYSFYNLPSESWHWSTSGN